MPTIIQLFAYDVPAYAETGRTPSKIIPCPFCRLFHVVGRDTKYVKPICVKHFASLIDVGAAPRQLLGAFLSGEPLPDDSDLWQLQPHELWGKVHQISEAVAAKLGAVEVR